MTEWVTEISSSGKDSVIRGVPLEEVMDLSFTEAIWLTLTGEKPTEKEEEMFNVVLSSCVDHGLGSPSTISARTVQSGGNPMNTSVAGGILAQGESHGGAGEECMRLLQSDKSAEEIVDEYLENGERIPGLGHRVYEEKDPRTEKMFEKAEELGIAGEHISKIKEIQKIMADRKLRLALNVDGGIAGVMSDLEIEPELGKGIFIIGRVPGLVAHVREEMDEKPFRREDGVYKGK